MRSGGLTLRDMTFSAARDMIEIRKLFQEPEYYRDMIAMSLETLKEKYDRSTAASDIIFYGYLYQEKKCFGLDYNDLIKFSLYIFRENEDIRLKWQQRLEYIMIDEFQDIDQLQYELMEVLCGYHGNLFDSEIARQTIYTWRGANVKYLLEFEPEVSGHADHPDDGELPLHAGDPARGQRTDREKSASGPEGTPSPLCLRGRPSGATLRKIRRRRPSGSRRRCGGFRGRGSRSGI